jgi:hypothetical protein
MVRAIVRHGALDGPMIKRNVEVSTVDPLTYAVVLGIMLSVTVIACPGITTPLLY